MQTQGLTKIERTKCMEGRNQVVIHRTFSTDKEEQHTGDISPINANGLDDQKGSGFDAMLRQLSGSVVTRKTEVTPEVKAVRERELNVAKKTEMLDSTEYLRMKAHQIEEMLQLHLEDPVVHNAKQLSKEYNMNLQLIEKVLSFYQAPNVKLVEKIPTSKRV
ncbi:hypothetical protein PROFUN_06658 [Planoprotostelium fungivorum]|uniref:Uncharacterized protein n=1 Tax=Planoprotostelium fungivorum TaxID=1890364 RepID=A0A2P6MSY9_9EUKA|nr:hypothetical protein PROFUN_06658 [Planoprotostelium fungivorum]